MLFNACLSLRLSCVVCRVSQCRMTDASESSVVLQLFPRRALKIEGRQKKMVGCRVDSSRRDWIQTSVWEGRQEAATLPCVFVSLPPPLGRTVTSLRSCPPALGENRGKGSAEKEIRRWTTSNHEPVEGRRAATQTSRCRCIIRTLIKDTTRTAVPACQSIHGYNGLYNIHPIRPPFSRWQKVVACSPNLLYRSA